MTVPLLIRYLCVFALFNAAAKSLCADQFLSLYIQHTTGSDFQVGIVNGLNGIAVLLIAYPAGKLADMYCLALYPKIACLAVPIGMWALGLFLAGEMQNHIAYLYAATMLIGIWDGLNQTLIATAISYGGMTTTHSCESLLKSQQNSEWQKQKQNNDSKNQQLQEDDDFSDSSHSSQVAFGQMESATLIGSALGPLIALLLLLLFSTDVNDDGEDAAQGSNRKITIVLFVGLGIWFTLMIAELIVLMVWNLNSHGEQISAVKDSSKISSESLTSATNKTTTCIPWMAFSSELLFAVGAGQTLAFMSLFFQNDLGATSWQIALTFLINPLLTALSAYLVSKYVKQSAAMSAIFLCYLVGSFGLLAMWWIQSKWISITVFWLRSAVLNSTAPLQRCFVLSLVNEKDLGKWNARENVASFLWCGSALFGGWLVQQYSYRFAFLITSGVYFIATAMWGLVCVMVWLQKRRNAFNEDIDRKYTHQIQ